MSDVSGNQTSVTLDVEARREEALNVTRGETQAAVHVKYRVRGTRRWTRLLVLPDETQTVEELIREAHLVAHAHYARAARGVTGNPTGGRDG